MESNPLILSPKFQQPPSALDEPPPLSSSLYVFANIIIAIIGSGVLGLPYAFVKVGWAAGLLFLLLAALLSYQGMILLVKSKQILTELTESTAQNEGRLSLHDEDMDASDSFQAINTYGDLASRILGTNGRILVDAVLVFTQSGFCIAYLIFIGENLSSIFTGETTQKALFIAIIIPFEIVVSWLKSLTQLAPLSLLADGLKLFALTAIVFHESFEITSSSNTSVVLAFTSIRNIPSFVSTAFYAFEGAGMTLPLESSMKEKPNFPLTLALSFFVITFIYGFFGIMGYAAYGINTCDIITLNLPSGMLTVAVKMAICSALFFTFPVMMHPVYEVYETYIFMSDSYRNVIKFSPRLQKLMFPVVRSVVVSILGVIAAAVPEFSQVLTFVGSALCSLLGFIFPAVFHLKSHGSRIGFFDKYFDYFLIVFGLVFGVWGTYDSIFD